MCMLLCMPCNAFSVTLMVLVFHSHAVVFPATLFCVVLLFCAVMLFFDSKPLLLSAAVYCTALCHSTLSLLKTSLADAK